jgi:hypothetical protein
MDAVPVGDESSDIPKELPGADNAPGGDVAAAASGDFVSVAGLAVSVAVPAVLVDKAVPVDEAAPVDGVVEVSSAAQIETMAPSRIRTEANAIRTFII